MAEKLTDIPIDIIISSPFPRATQTAETVAKKIGKRIEISDLFVERRNPSVVFDKRDHEPGVRGIVEAVEKNFHVLGWRHSDEENFSDLKTRAKAALAYLAKLPY